jgi:hypothetical protein
MGLMKKLFIDIRNSLNYQEADEQEKKRILENWHETDEAKALVNKTSRPSNN